MNKQQKAVSQQGIEIWGDILSWGTDVPSARDHRRVLETLKLLRLNNTEMRSTVLSGTQTNRALLRSLHLLYMIARYIHTLICQRFSVDISVSLLQIPMADMSDTNKVKILTPANTRHSDLSIALLNQKMLYYRLLSDVDYMSCIETGPDKSLPKKAYQDHVRPHS